MAEQSKALQKPAPEEASGVAAPRLEQLLFACGGYVLAQLVVLMISSDPSDGDYLVLGITGAFIGVVVHVLVRGLGLHLAGVGRRLRMRATADGAPASGEGVRSGAPDRSSRYRAALSAFRKPFKRRRRRSEAPGNDEKIVRTADGFRVGGRVFSRLSEAEDYLYVGEPPGGDRRTDEEKSAFAAQHFRPARWRRPKVLNALVLAIVIALVGIVLFSP